MAADERSSSPAPAASSAGTSSRRCGCATTCELYAVRSGLPPSSELDGRAVARADVIFHLAGVNRPPTPEEYETGNAGFTQELCDRLAPPAGRRDRLRLVHPGGTGQSLWPQQAARGGEPAAVLRRDRRAGHDLPLDELFGKWCRPNYNSVTATFCHNIAHGLPIQISDPGREVELAYIDDVVAALLAELVRQVANLPSNGRSAPARIERDDRRLSRPIA